jgi:hypothetical protein
MPRIANPHFLRFELRVPRWVTEEMIATDVCTALALPFCAVADCTDVLFQSQVRAKQVAQRGWSG